MLGVESSAPEKLPDDFCNMFAESIQLETLKSTLSLYKIERAPSNVYYIPEFISKEDEKRLIGVIESAPEEKWGFSEFFKQDYGKICYPDGRIRLDGGEIPVWAAATLNRITVLQRAFTADAQPKFLRVNKYLPGQGIQPHRDFQSGSRVNNILSMGVGRPINFYYPPQEEVGNEDSDHEDRLICSIWLEPRSLLIFSDDAFNYLWHGVPRTDQDTITKKTLNRPDGFSVGDKVECKGFRYSIVSEYEGCSRSVCHKSF